MGVSQPQHQVSRREPHIALSNFVFLRAVDIQRLQRGQQLKKPGNSMLADDRLTTEASVDVP